MTDRKREKPLFIGMDFDEALRRFAQTDKKESDELAKREKSKKKAGKGKGPPGSRVNRNDGSG